jgi:hypothetical protein
MKERNYTNTHRFLKERKEKRYEEVNCLGDRFTVYHIGHFFNLFSVFVVVISTGIAAKATREMMTVNIGLINSRYFIWQEKNCTFR